MALSLLALLTLSVSPILAANVHFVSGPTFDTSNGALTVSGKLAGLGNRDVTIVVSGTATVTCTNRGGNVPPGQTETVSGTVSNLRPENGTVTFSVTTAQVTDTCPGPMTPTATFTSATVQVYQNGRLVLQQSFSL
jgi:hypothetical protein